MRVMFINVRVVLTNSWVVWVLQYSLGVRKVALMLNKKGRGQLSTLVKVLVFVVST